MISFLRSRSDLVIRYSPLLIVGEMSILGLDMISDIVYILSLYSSHIFIAAATVMLVVRLIHPCTSMYVINSFFGTGKTSMYYTKLIDIRHLAPNAKLYGLLLMIALVETTAIKFLPWIVTEFSVMSGGYPDIFIFRLCGYSKVGQSLVSLVVQTVVLVHLRKDHRNSNSCDFILVITFVSTVLVVVMTLFEIVFQVVSVSNMVSDNNSTSDSNSVSMTAVRIENEITNPITSDAASIISSTTTSTLNSDRYNKPSLKKKGMQEQLI